MIQNELLAKQALAIAQSHIGEKELTGHNDGVFVRMLQRWLANGSKWMDGQPWCATYATWCMYQAAKVLGITPLIPKNGSSTSIYAFAIRHGLILLNPRHGCIGLLKGTGGTAGKTHHHTFIVESVDPANGIVHSVDGNWKNSVTKTTHRMHDCSFVMMA